MPQASRIETIGATAGKTAMMLRQTPKLSDTPSAAGERSEQFWIDRAKQGDADACAWLLERYRARILRLALHVLHNADDAEDAAQDAFVSALSGIRRFRGDCSFYTWLFRIAFRTCLNRRRSVRSSAELIVEPGADKQGTLDDRIVIDEMLGKLSPQIRAALLLRVVEELSYSEIAYILEIPEGTVKSRLSAARIQMQQMWDQTISEVRQ